MDRPQTRLLGNNRLRGKRHAAPTSLLDAAPFVIGNDSVSGDRSELAQAVCNALQPVGPVENLLVESVIDGLDAIRLQHTPDRRGRCSASRQRTIREVRDLIVTLDRLRSLSARTKFGRLQPSRRPPLVVDASLHNPDEAFAAVPRGTTIDSSSVDEKADPTAEPADVSSLWRDRLVLDSNISSTSPVVVGTHITVRQIVSLVVDGWSWAAIRTRFPELEEADIRGCLAYCVEEEGGGISYH